MYYKNPVSFILVSIQLILMFSLLLAGPALPQNPLSFLLISAGLVLGLWALSHMFSRGKFNGFPEPAPGASLLTSGPYKFIRNPMYTAILIGGLGLVLNDLSFIRLILLFLLFCILIYKIRLEEYYLSRMFSDYKSYAAKTPRLFPGIY